MVQRNSALPFLAAPVSMNTNSSLLCRIYPRFAFVALRWPLLFVTLCILLPWPSIAQAQEGPSLHDTTEYLVRHINDTTTAYFIPDGSRWGTGVQEDYRCVALPGDVGLQLQIRIRQGPQDNTITRTVLFRDLDPDSIQIEQTATVGLLQACDLTILSNKGHSERLVYLSIQQTEAAQRIARAFRKAALLCGATTDPFAQ
jgi:hypothetical protein